ncbi:hypothetical protein ACP70R_014123 [Stipagrostis hirtigluma subsp. patula]
MDAGGPAPARAPHDGHASNRGTSALAAVSVVLILLYLFSRFLCQYKKHATGAATSPSPSAAPQQPSCPSRSAAACLGAGEAAPARRARETTTSLLPVFVRGAEKAADCAVCLAELGVGDAAGLVPGCGHVFHAECIEAWFRVNSTCPLCRGAVAAAGQGAGEAPLCSSV